MDALLTLTRAAAAPVAPVAVPDAAAEPAKHSCDLLLPANRGQCSVPGCKAPGAKFACMLCQVRFCDPNKSQCVTKHLQGEVGTTRALIKPEYLANVSETGVKQEPPAVPEEAPAPAAAAPGPDAASSASKRSRKR